MAFLEIKRGHWGGEPMPQGIIRVNPKSLAISEDVSEKFQGGRITQTSAVTGNDYEVVKLGLAVDVDTKQIKLIPNALNGFRFHCKTDSYRYLFGGKPSAFRKTGLPLGDYQLTDEKELIFTLAE